MGIWHRRLAEPHRGYRMTSLPALHRTCWLAQAVLSISAASIGAAMASSTQAQDVSLNDLARTHWRPHAELADVHFIDSQCGWAVGDHGAIWSTTDGGQTWVDAAQSLPIGVATVRWESVFFIDHRTGWIAGGLEYPYVPLSRGVILQTRDGGQTWQILGLSRLPHLFQIAFDRNLGGYAIGRTSPFFKTGLYTTADGGNHWTSDDAQDWIDLRVAVPTDRGWIGVTHDGKLVTRHAGRAELNVYSSNYDDTCFFAVAMTNGMAGWAVGDRGTLVSTTDGGLTWQTPTQWQDHQLAMSGMTFKSVAWAAGKVWMVGDPGDAIWQYDPRTGDLQRHPTNTSLPLNRIKFVDAQHGWAVGGGGQVVRTTDGGNSWETIRQSESEVTILAVAFDSADLAYEAIARLTTEDGYKSAGIILYASDSAIDRPRIHQAVSRLGMTTLLMRRFSSSVRADQARLREEMIEHLARAIRQLRPRVMICNAGQFKTRENVWGETRSILEDAARRAAERVPLESSNPMITDRPWQVDRLAIRDASATSGWQVYTDQTLPRIGETVGDHAALSRAFVGLPLWDRQPLVYQVVRLTAAGLDLGNLLGGLAEAGRRLPHRGRDQVQRGNLNMLKQVQNKMENKSLLLNERTDESNDLAIWNRRVFDWTAAADSHCAGVWLAELANDYLHQGELTLAMASLNLLTDRYPDHPLAPAAHRWLVQAAANVETHIARERRLPKILPVARGSVAEQPLSEPQRTTIVPSGEDEDGGVIQVAWQSDARTDAISANEIGKDSSSAPPGKETTPLTQRVMQQTSWQLNRLRAMYPELATSNEIRFQEANVTRMAKKWAEAQPLYRSIAAQRRPQAQQLAVDSWCQEWAIEAAQRELDLQAERWKTDLGMTARRAASRPVLDGRLDDALWSELLSNGGALFLRGNASHFASSKMDVLMAAYDDEFLFVACRVQKVAAHSYLRTNEPRPRDANLEIQDRLIWSFDLDRNQAWPLTLIVDSRGWTRDQCGASPCWNPQWFVATEGGDGYWTAEWAIPWSQFGDTCPAAGTTWGLHCRRQLARHQTIWNWPAPTTMDIFAEEFSLLPDARMQHFAPLRFD